MGKQAAYKELEGSFITGRDDGKYDHHHRDAIRSQLRLAWYGDGCQNKHWEEVITQSTKCGDDGTIGSKIETIIWLEREKRPAFTPEKAVVDGRIVNVTRLNDG